MNYMPPGRVARINDERFPRFVIRDGVGQYLARDDRWSDKPSDAVLFHTEATAIEERNRCCLGGDVADTFTATVVVTVHARRWSEKDLARCLKRHRQFFIQGYGGKEGLLLEVVPDTLRKVEP